MVLAFMGFLLVFLRLEKAITSDSRKNTAHNSNYVGSNTYMCGGFALLAGNGITGDGPFGLNWRACSLLIIGGFVALFRTPKFNKK